MQNEKRKKKKKVHLKQVYVYFQSRYERIFEADEKKYMKNIYIYIYLFN